MGRREFATLDPHLLGKHGAVVFRAEPSFVPVMCVVLHVFMFSSYIGISEVGFLSRAELPTFVCELTLGQLFHFPRHISQFTQNI